MRTSHFLVSSGDHHDQLAVVALRAHIEGLLGCRVHAVDVKAIDLVSDTTTVEVRYAIARVRDSVTPSSRRIPSPAGAR